MLLSSMNKSNCQTNERTNERCLTFSSNKHCGYNGVFSLLSFCTFSFYLTLTLCTSFLVLCSLIMSFLSVLIFVSLYFLLMQMVAFNSFFFFTCSFTNCCHILRFVRIHYLIFVLVFFTNFALSLSLSQLLSFCLSLSLFLSLPLPSLFISLQYFLSSNYEP